MMWSFDIGVIAISAKQFRNKCIAIIESQPRYIHATKKKIFQNTKEYTCSANLIELEQGTVANL